MIINCKRLIYLVTALVLTSQHALAGNSSNSGSSSSSSSSSSKYQTTYTIEEIANFVTTFATIPPYPSDFSWEDSQIYTPTTSGKPIITGFTPVAVIPTVTLGSDSDGTLQIASLSELGYEGVKCAAGIYKFPITITDSNNIPQPKVVEVNLPLAPQKLASPNPLEDNSQSQQTLLCKNHIAAVAGKVVNGNIVFQCQAGLWRIKQVGCKDSESSCNGAPNTVVSVPSASNGTFPNTLFNLPSVKYADGAPAGVFACKDVLPAPLPGPAPTNYQWSGNVNLSCSSGAFSAGSNNCTVIDASNNVYPNCATGVIGRLLYNGQTIGRACFPAGTNMATRNLGFVKSSIGPNVYSGSFETAIPFFWVKRDVFINIALVTETLACGRYLATTNTNNCVLGWTCSTPTSNFGMGGVGYSGGINPYYGIGGTTNYSTSTTYQLQSIACPR